MPLTPAWSVSMCSQQPSQGPHLAGNEPVTDPVSRKAPYPSRVSPETCTVHLLPVLLSPMETVLHFLGLILTALVPYRVSVETGEVCTAAAFAIIALWGKEFRASSSSGVNRR